MTYTDPTTGREYEVIDWKFVGGKRKRFALGADGAEGRAFVPAEPTATVVYEYKRVFDYRDTTPRNLSRQFAEAVPPGSTPLEQMRAKGYPIDLNSRKHGYGR